MNHLSLFFFFLEFFLLPWPGSLILIHQEYEALSTFYLQLNGTKWRKHCSDSWNFNSPSLSDPCDDNWYGITCSSNKLHIQLISLGYCSLQGRLPLEIGLFNDLRLFNVSHNSITGQIPETFSSLKMLSILSLNSNSMTGTVPLSFSLLSAFEIFNLTSNSFTGKFPSLNLHSQIKSLSISYNDFSDVIEFPVLNCSELSDLDISFNRFSGSLPTSFGTCSSLKRLILSHNLLTGSIPSSISKFSDLMVAYFDVNYLTGSIPSFFSHLTDLYYLNMSHNQLTNILPYQDCDDTTTIGYNISLYVIDLSHNYLSGSISSCLGTLSTIENLYLTSNLLSGSIPSILFQNTGLLSLSLSMNYLTSSLPASFDLPCLQNLYLSSNYLTSTLPQSLEGMINLIIFDIDSNLLSGTIPVNLFNQSAMTLRYLYLHNNRFTGTFPTELTKQQKLQHILIFNNHFTHHIPSTLSKLNNLETLLLQGNRFIGHPNDFLINSTTSQPFFPKLQALDISNNLFDGSFPNEIFQISSLRYLSIISSCYQGNINFDSLCNLTKLEVLLLDGVKSSDSCQVNLFDPMSIISNSFYFLDTSVSTQIPQCIGRLKALQTLHLSGNKFTGSIPSSISFLNSLRDLTLSYNEFKGTIPFEILKKPYLKLDLSHNKLSGSFHQLNRRNFTKSSTSTAKTSIKLNGNRLSGIIPIHELNKIDDIHVLSGNLFPCENENSLPDGDPDHESYICASDDYDFSLILWLIFFGFILLTVLLVLGFLFQSDNSFQFCQEIKTSVENSWKILKKWIHAIRLVSFEDHPELFRYLQVFDALRVITLEITVFIVVTCCVYYPITKTYGSTATHSTQYRWLYSAAYLSGIEPAIFILLIYIIVLVYFLHQIIQKEYYLKDTSSLTNPPTNSVSFHSLLLFFSKITNSLSNTSINNSSINYKDDKNRNNLLYSYTAVMILLVFNCLIVLTIKGIYVYATNTHISTNIKLFLQILLSIFDFIWGNFILSKFITSSLSFMRSKVRVRLHLALIIFNGIIAPILASIITDSNCLNSLFTSQEEITSNADFTFCKRLEITHSMMMRSSRSISMEDEMIINESPSSSSSSEPNCLEYDSIRLSTSYIPPYTYSYQCTSSILTNFIPVFLFSCIVLTFVFPLINSLLAYLASNYSNSEKYLRRLPGVLHPMASMNQPQHLVMHSGIIISGILQQIVILLTFGISSPPLAVAIFITIYSITWHWQLLIGRYLVYQMEHQSKTNDDKESNVNLYNLLEKCVYGVWLGPVQSVWTMIDVSSIFFGVLLFDIAGDTIGGLQAFCYFTIPTLFIPVLLRVIYREYWRYLLCQRIKTQEDSIVLENQEKSTKNPVLVNEVRNLEFSLKDFHFHSPGLH